jgi:AIPR protein
MEPITIVLTGVKGASKTKEPSDPNQYDISALVPVEEVAKHISSGPFANLREGCPTDPTALKRSGRIIKSMKSQLMLDPQWFCRKNNGITIFADEATAEVHGKPGTLSITYSDSSFLREYKNDKNDTQQIRGIGNGGTTAGAIAEAIAEEIYPNANGTAYVRVTARCGSYIRKEVSDMVEGLNRNKQVDSFSLANYLGDFDEIKKFLGSDKAEVAGYAFPPVAYYSGASGSYEIQDLIQFLTLFVRVDEDEDPIPASSYAGVESCLNYFRTEKGKKECLRYLPLLPQIVYLYEFIVSNVKNAYNKKQGKFFQLSIFEGMELPKEEELPFSHLKTKIRINNGWVFPILAAFIPVVSDNKMSWKTNPQTMFLHLAPKMIKDLNDIFLEMGGSKGGRVSSLGRTASTYTVLRSIVTNSLSRQGVR